MWKKIILIIAIVILLLLSSALHKLSFTSTNPFVIKIAFGALVLSYLWLIYSLMNVKTWSWIYKVVFILTLLGGTYWQISNQYDTIMEEAEETEQERVG